MPATLEATVNPTPAKRQMPVHPERLRANVKFVHDSIDREKGVLRGAILAEEGVFKTERGEFDRRAIRSIVKMGNEKTGGLLSRFTHPNDSNDSLGKHLGRIRNLRSDTVMREVGKDDDGRPLMKEILVARGDIHFDPTALDTPPSGGKPLGVYVMDLANSDEGALGMSLVIKPKKEFRIDKAGRPLRDDKGAELPPLWFPEALHACDCVGSGDATNSMLSGDLIDGLPNAVVIRGTELLDAQFADQPREVIAARLTAFVDRYLAYRFGDGEAEGFGAEQAAEPELSVAQAEAPDEIEGTVDEALALDLWLATEGE